MPMLPFYYLLYYAYCMHGLRKLSINDGQDVFEMLSQIPAVENGFNNHFHGLSFEEFKAKLVEAEGKSRGIGLDEGHVPQTYFWFYVDNRPVGVVKLRHYLTDALKLDGGNIGYSIVPKERGKGYGKKMLELALVEARKLGIDEVRITCDVDNEASRKVALGNGGKLTKITDDTAYYDINLKINPQNSLWQNIAVVVFVVVLVLCAVCIFVVNFLANGGFFDNFVIGNSVNSYEERDGVIPPAV